MTAGLLEHSQSYKSKFLLLNIANHLQFSLLWYHLHKYHRFFFALRTVFSFISKNKGESNDKNALHFPPFSLLTC